jgi:hypothetical protein
MGTRTFMVVATIREDSDMTRLAALVPAEVAHVERLREQGLMGSIHVALSRRTVFIETLADDEAEAVRTVETLPLAEFFEIDVYPTTPAEVPQTAGQRLP